MPNKKQDKPLTYKQQLFVDAYAGNAAEAARIAGYKQPQVIGSRLFRKVEIKEAIRKRDNGNGKRRNKTLEKIMTQEEIRAAYSDIARDPDHKDRLKALDSLARCYAMFSDNVNISGQIEHLSDTQLTRKLTAALIMLGVKQHTIDQHIAGLLTQPQDVKPLDVDGTVESEPSNGHTSDK